jgi:hypothetical protein
MAAPDPGAWATDGRAAFTRLYEARQAAPGYRPEEAGELIREAVPEWERARLSCPVPGASSGSPLTFP